MREHIVKERPKRKPTHPGALLRDEVLPDMRVSVSQFARNIRVSRQLLYGILNEDKSITPSVALKLGKYIGNGPNLWLRMQQAYDLWRAKKELVDVLAEIPQHAPSLRQNVTK